MLLCEGIEMSFGGVPVLKGVDLRLRPGTVTALAGENGAGKSTLMKIASGQYKPDAGEVRVLGEILPAGNTKAANERGVAIVPQELASIPELTVYEHLFIGREIRTPLGTLNRRAMIAEARKARGECGLAIEPAGQVSALPCGGRPSSVV